MADTLRRTFPPGAAGEGAALRLPPEVDPISGMEIPNPGWARHCFLGHSPSGLPPSLLRSSLARCRRSSPHVQIPQSQSQSQSQSQLRNDPPPPVETRSQILRFASPPWSLDVYCEAAQLVAYEQAKCILEAWGSRMFAPLSGVLIWKAHASWPGLRSSLVDFFGDTGGGLAAAGGVLRECDAHAQLNPRTRSVEVVRAAPFGPTRDGGGGGGGGRGGGEASDPKIDGGDAGGFLLVASRLRLDGSPAWAAEAVLLAANYPRGATTRTSLIVPSPPPSNSNAPTFLRLELFELPPAPSAAPSHRMYGALLSPLLPQPDSKPIFPIFPPPFPRGRRVSRNVYLLPSLPGGDLTALQAWRRRGVGGRGLAASFPKGELPTFVDKTPPMSRTQTFGADAASPRRVEGVLRLRNTGRRVACFIRLTVRRLAPNNNPPAALGNFLRACCAQPACGGDGDGADDAERGDNRVLPVVWGANFITLWPGETTDIRFSFPSAAVAPPLRRGEALFVCAVGLNAAATLRIP